VLGGGACGSLALTALGLLGAGTGSIRQ